MTGKAILFGEHAVVYGVPAIAIPIDRHLSVEVIGSGHGPELAADCWKVAVRLDVEQPDARALQQAFGLALDLTPRCPHRIIARVDSEIPRSAGLGSSAALSVALVRALAGYAGESLAPDEELSRAAEIEKIFHANPSGIDHSVVAIGRPIVFRKQGGAEAGVDLGRIFKLVIATAGSHGGTAARVQALARRRQSMAELYQNAFAAIGQVVERALLALKKGDAAEVGALMDFNQGLLNALGVSSPELERGLGVAREAGALGAKLSGAGGGGAFLALCDDDPQPVLRALRGAGFEPFVTTLAPDGQGKALIEEIGQAARR
ncbi:MAG: mevalonate kinase [Deltaproteobacteria bacterium]|nr:mevalonate kinase [Deltaproteobacteria bacterium]